MKNKFQKFSEGTKVFSKLLKVEGVVNGYSIQGGVYAIEDKTGYVWHLDEKAELVEVKN